MSESVQKILARLEPIRQRVVRGPLNQEALASLEKETGLPIPRCLREYFLEVGLFQDLTTGSGCEYELFERAEEFPSIRKWLVEHFGKAAAELFPFAGDGAGNIIAAAPGKDCDRLFFADHETLELKEVGSFCDWLSSVVNAALSDEREENTLKHWFVQFSFKVATSEPVLKTLQRLGAVELGAWSAKKTLPSGVETSQAPLRFAGEALVLKRSDFSSWESPRFSLDYDEPVTVAPEESRIRQLDAAFRQAAVGYQLVDYGPLLKSAVETAEAEQSKPADGKRPGFFKLRRWQRQIAKIKTGMTRPEVDRQLGLASRKVSGGEIEIWSYDLERTGGIAYSIRVAFDKNVVCQCYMGLEAYGKVAPPRRPLSTERIAGIVALALSLVLGYVSVYRPISHAAQHKPVDLFVIKWAALLPALILTGMVLTVLGSRSSRFPGAGKWSQWITLAIVVITTAVGLGLYWWVDQAVGNY
jgi:hypothetical protein